MTKTIESPAADDDTGVEPAGGRSRFRPDIEALRAIAVVAVLAFHAGVPGFEGGFVGVDVFFVISGFLITAQMLRDADGGGLRFRDFYARRARRLLPAATVVIVATLVGSALFLSPLIHASVGADARSATLFFSNMRFAADATDYFAAGRHPSPFQQFWSLSVEEQFYLVWPALVSVALIGAVTARAHRRRLAVVLGALVVVSFGLCVWLTTYEQPWAFFWLAPRAWELAVGALLAVGATRLGRLGPGVRAATGVGGLLLVAGSVVLMSEGSHWPGAWAAFPVVGTALVVAAGVGGHAPVLGRALAWAPFQWGGRYSYSLYLWHWPALICAAAVFPTVATNWMKGSAIVLASVVPAVVSYHLVENPARRSPLVRSTGRTLTMGAALIVVSLLASVLYGMFTVGGTLDAGRPAPVSGAAIGSDLPITDFVPSDLAPSLESMAGGRQVPQAPGCESFDGSPSLSCTLGEGDAAPTMAVFGDSHAAHWAPAFEEYANREGIRIRRFAAGACGSILYPPTGGSTRNCDQWRDTAFETIAAEQPEVVVLANQSYKGFQRDAAEWEAGLRASIERLSPSTRVVILGETPWADESVPDCLAGNLEDTEACEPDGTLRMLRQINEREQQVAVEEGAGWIDASAWLCVDQRCPTVVGNLLVYTDQDHLAVPFVLSRTDLLQAALNRERGLVHSG